MVQSCSAFGCKTRYEKHMNVKFHKYPKDPELKNQWVRAINEPWFIPSVYSVVCSNHFLEEDYTINVLGNKILTRTAIPKKIYTCSIGKAVENVPGKEISELDKFSLDHSYSLASKTIVQKTGNALIDNLCKPKENFPQPSSDEKRVPYLVQNVAKVYNKSNLLTVTHTSNFETHNKKRQFCRYIGDFVEEDLEVPPKRKLFWIAFQKFKSERDKELKVIKCKNRKLQNKVKELQALIDNLESVNKMSTDCNVVAYIKM